MQVQIQVIKVKDKFFPSAKGGYSVLEVTYQNLTQGGKTEGKKVISFGDYAHVYEAAKNWEEDQIVTLQLEKVYSKKDDRDYWTWVDIVNGDTATGEVVEKKKEATVATGTGGAAKQQWVPDADKQRLIVRQSSLAQAVNFDKDNNATIDDVLRTASRFFDWVFEQTTTPTEKAEKAATDTVKKAGRPRKEVADSEVE